MNQSIRYPEFVVPGALLILCGGIGLVFVLHGALAAEPTILVGTILGILAGGLLILRARIGTLLYFLILGGLIILEFRGLFTADPFEWAKSLFVLVIVCGFLSMGRSQICYHRNHEKQSDSQRPVVVKDPRIWIAKCVMMATAIYVGCFFPLWLGGGYVLTESGRVRSLMGISTGIAAPDVAEWQPLLGHYQPAYHWPTGSISPRCDLIGWIYYPFWSLIRVQHPSVSLLDDRGMIVPAPEFPAGFSIHPLRGRELASVMLDGHRTAPPTNGKPPEADKPSH